MGSEGGGVRGVLYTHTHGFRGSYSTQYFKPRSVLGAQKGAARRNQAHRTPRSTISTGEWPQEDSGGPNLVFFSPKPPLPPHLGGEGNFSLLFPISSASKSSKGSKTGSVGSADHFGGGYEPKFASYPTLCDGQGKSPGLDKGVDKGVRGTFFDSKTQKKSFASGTEACWSLKSGPQDPWDPICTRESPK